MPRFTSASIDAVAHATDFVSIVEQYTKLERRGSTWWGCCPFHNEKTPSFQVNPEKKLFYCFGCHKGGSLFNFVMEMENISFAQCVSELAKRAHIDLVYEDGGSEFQRSEEEKLKDELYILYEKVAKAFHHILLHTKQGENAYRYLAERNVPETIITDFMLGFAPVDRRWLFRFLNKKGYQAAFLAQSGLFSKKYPEISFFSNRLMFPICDRHGRVIAFGGRSLSNDPKSPKYLNSGDMVQYQKKYNLFALNHALPEMRKEKAVIFCEGYMDVLAFHHAGMRNAVAPLGTALTDEQINIAAPLVERIYLCFDSDEAGQNASLRAIEMCARHEVEAYCIKIENAKDPAEVLEKYGVEGLKKILKNAIIGSDFFVQQAMTRFNISTAAGKAKASEFLFPYLQTVRSNVKREALISQFSTQLRISSEALRRDFHNNVKQIENRQPEQKPLSHAERPFQKNAETRALLAVFANPELFKTMRARLSSDDFSDEDAKTLFIFMEEAYRDECSDTGELMTRLNDSRLHTAVTASILSGEFSKNAETIVADSIATIKVRNLNRQRQMLIHKLNLLSTQNESAADTEVNDIIAYIEDLNRQIAEFKKN